MRKFFLIAGGLLLAFLAAPSPASADVLPQSVTLDGGTAWTTGGGFTDGDSVTVAPGDTITVVLTVNAGGNTNWQCTSWDIGGGASSGTDDFEPDHDTNNFIGASESFEITAPATEGTFDLVLNARSNDICSGQQGLVTLVDAVIVAGPAGIFSKELISGPNDNDGAPIAVTVDANDAGGVLVKHPDSQHFEFKITVTNDEAAGTLDGLKILDVVGAEFDPDPDAEDDAFGDPAPADDCQDGTCDGIAAGGTGSCTASITPHDPARQLDPHFIHIELVALGAGETCEVTVWVKTDENPASVKDTGEADDVGNLDEKFEPTGCHLVMAPNLFDTFTLNEGLKVFDPSPGIRILGPVGSLQLTCNFP